MAGYSVPVQIRQGGKMLKIGSTATLDIHGTLKIAGAAVSLAGSLVSKFTFADTSPVALGTVPAGKHVVRVTLKITTTFDNGSATLAVGDAGSAGRLMATTDNLPGTASAYLTVPGYEYVAATAVRLTITPAGSTQGAGVVIVEYA